MPQDLSRKSMIAASLGVAAAAGLNARTMVARAAPGASEPSPGLLRALKSGIPPNDGLAHPIPYRPLLGAGKDRALALGGGAIYLVSFYSGYFTSLAANGVDLKRATSSSGHLQERSATTRS
jgi:hypothetical protein